VWRIPNLEEDEDFLVDNIADNKRQKTHNYEDGRLHGSIRDNRKPIVKFQASTGVPYSIGFIHASSLLLGICGDEGVQPLFLE
jgi:hypothetical protein